MSANQRSDKRPRFHHNQRVIWRRRLYPDAPDEGIKAAEISGRGWIVQKPNQSQYLPNGQFMEQMQFIYWVQEVDEYCKLGEQNFYLESELEPLESCSLTPDLTPPKIVGYMPPPPVAHARDLALPRPMWWDEMVREAFQRLPHYAPDPYISPFLVVVEEVCATIRDLNLPTQPRLTEVKFSTRELCKLKLLSIRIHSDRYTEDDYDEEKKILVNDIGYEVVEGLALESTMHGVTMDANNTSVSLMIFKNRDDVLRQSAFPWQMSVSPSEPRSNLISRKLFEITFYN